MRKTYEQPTISAEKLKEYCDRENIPYSTFARKYGLGGSTPAGWIKKGAMPVWVGEMIDNLDMINELEGELSIGRGGIDMTILKIPSEHINAIEKVVVALGGELINLSL